VVPSVPPYRSVISFDCAVVGEVTGMTEHMCVSPDRGRGVVRRRVLFGGDWVEGLEGGEGGVREVQIVACAAVEGVSVL
jgi:hypothetical protein